jgi:glycosyltransferase involved in cell wall biosynthesis
MTAPFFRLSLANISRRLFPHYDLPVSIIIPLYNREQCIERAIQSAQDQTLQGIEILVVDDHSTDSSLQIVRRLASQDHRIRIVQHRENEGTHLARATAVREARGTFILSLDPDDRLVPTIADEALKAAVEEHADIVEFQAIQYINATNSSTLFSFLPPRLSSGTGRWLAVSFGKGRLNWNIWKRLIRRRTYLDGLELLKLREVDRKIVYGEDKLHVGLVFLVAERFVYIKVVGYIYYQDSAENSESGPMDKLMAGMSQLRYVERLLKAIYRMHSGLVYNVNNGIPAGVRARLEPKMPENISHLLGARRTRRRQH